MRLAVFVRVIKSIERLALRFELRRQDAPDLAAAVAIMALFDDRTEGVAALEIGQKVDIVFKDFRQIENMLRRESGVDAAFIQAALDGAANHARLLH